MKGNVHVLHYPKNIFVVAIQTSVHLFNDHIATLSKWQHVLSLEVFKVKIHSCYLAGKIRQKGPLTIIYFVKCF